MDLNFLRNGQITEMTLLKSELLAGRVWAGHNIVRFDSARIREVFAEIGRPPPEPKGLIDTLPLLTQRFGRRAGDMKVRNYVLTRASLYFLKKCFFRKICVIMIGEVVLKRIYI